MFLFLPVTTSATDTRLRHRRWNAQNTNNHSLEYWYCCASAMALRYGQATVGFGPSSIPYMVSHNPGEQPICCIDGFDDSDWDVFLVAECENGMLLDSFDDLQLPEHTTPYLDNRWPARAQQPVQIIDVPPASQWPQDWCSVQWFDIECPSSFSRRNATASGRPESDDSGLSTAHRNSNPVISHNNTHSPWPHVQQAETEQQQPSEGSVQTANTHQDSVYAPTPKQNMTCTKRAGSPGVNKKSRRRHCRNCGIHRTPQWRTGPEGPHTLCNACGMRFNKGLSMIRSLASRPKGKLDLPLTPQQGDVASQPTRA